MAKNVAEERSGPRAWASLVCLQTRYCAVTRFIPSFAVSRSSFHFRPKIWGKWFEQHNKIYVLCKETPIKWGSYPVSLSPCALTRMLFHGFVLIVCKSDTNVCPSAPLTEEASRMLWYFSKPLLFSFCNIILWHKVRREISSWMNPQKTTRSPGRFFLISAVLDMKI